MEVEEDEVVKEIDVFLTKDLATKLWLLQYPVRPSDCSYEEEQFLSAKVKPKQKLLQFEVGLDTTASTYSKSKGEHLAMSVDGPKGPPSYPSGKLDRMPISSSQSVSDCSRYAIGAVKNGQVHLTPLSAVVQMRPELSYLDQAEAASKARAKLMELEAAGDSSQDEEEEAKAVTVKFARQETAEQKSRRMQSYDYRVQKQKEENWVHCTYWKTYSESSGQARHRLLGHKQEDADVYCQPSEYLSMLIPQQEADLGEVPDLPTNVLSAAQLKAMPLTDRVRALLRSAKVIKWNQLLELLGSDVDVSSAMKALQQVAVLVRGCWVIKSEILYPKDSFSAHSSSPAEVIARARDYLLWRYTQSPVVIRRDITNIVKIPADEMKEMLEQVARPKPKMGWIFYLEYDNEFVEKNQEVVRRQQMLWDVKYQQLAKHFKLPKDPKESLTKRRRRHSSRSKSRSDMSDTDGEPTSDIKKDSPHLEAMPSDTNGTASVDAAPVPPGATLSDELRQELSSLLRDKLLERSILSMTDMRTIYQTKLAQCEPGHILATGVSDNVLEKVMLSVGATKINYMGPPGSSGPFFLLTKADNKDDNVREIIIGLFQNQPKLKFQTLSQEVETRGITKTENELKNLIKEYCVVRGGLWFLKGTAEPTAPS